MSARHQGGVFNPGLPPENRLKITLCQNYSLSGHLLTWVICSLCWWGDRRRPRWQQAAQREPIQAGGSGHLLWLVYKICEYIYLNQFVQYLSRWYFHSRNSHSLFNGNVIFFLVLNLKHIDSRWKQWTRAAKKFLTFCELILFNILPCFLSNAIKVVQKLISFYMFLRPLSWWAEWEYPN